MKLLILYDGDYGKRFLDNISKNAPKAWEVLGYHYTKSLPPFIEELSDYVPADLPSCDLLISVQEHPIVAELIPLFIIKIGAKAVITPIDNKAYLSSGLARQLKRKLEKEGIELLHPKTFCTLTLDLHAWCALCADPQFRDRHALRRQADRQAPRPALRRQVRTAPAAHPGSG